jgi:hypothetical protein
MLCSDLWCCARSATVHAERSVLGKPRPAVRRHVTGSLTLTQILRASCPHAWPELAVVVTRVSVETELN